jgi:hypothetical protein
MLTANHWKANRRLQNASSNNPALKMRGGQNPADAAAVLLLQQALNKLAGKLPQRFGGCAVTGSGTYDQETAVAVAEFQAVANIEVDGKAVHQTLHQMDFFLVLYDPPDRVAEDAKKLGRSVFDQSAL